MGLVSLGFNDDGIEVFGRVLLSRKEAASYAGVSESGIRDAESRGLRHAMDADGRAWLDPEDLDAWTWRKPMPSTAKRVSIVRAAARQRLHEMRQRELQAEKLVEAENAAAEAEHAALMARWQREDDLRREADATNRAAAEAFLHRHLDRSQVRDILGLSAGQASTEIRRLCKMGLLREVAPPLEVIVGEDANGEPTLERGARGVVWGGPHYVREDALVIQREIMTLTCLGSLGHGLLETRLSRS